MSNSEMHSEKAASDEEDLKANIPFFNEANNSLLASQVRDYESLPRKVNKDEECSHNYDYTNWDDNDNNDFIQENVSRLDSDYATYSANENTNYFPPSTSMPVSVPTSSLVLASASELPSISASATSTAYQDDAVCEMKYSPQEMILHPPLSAALRYSYNYPNPTQGHSRQSGHSVFAHPQNPIHGGLHSSHLSSDCYPQHPSSLHPNMWYPNAPYGNGGYYRPYGSQRYAPYNTGYSNDPMMDMLHLSNSGREARNRAEKNRRDKLNGSIQELSTMVPHVAESPRRVDKTAVLRFAAHGLRLQYVFGGNSKQQHQQQTLRPQVTDTLMKLLDSFFITLTCHGQIVLVSSSIEQHLGHCQTDLFGQNILHITHPEDHNMLKKQLIPTDLENLFDIRPDEESGEPRPRTQVEEESIDRRLREDKRSFTVRLARAGPRSEPITYEVVKLDGSFRRSDSAPRGVKTGTFPSSLQLIRRTRGRDDSIPLQTISGNDIVLIAIARIIRPPKVLNRLLEVNSLEYKTRHLIDGRIIDCDQRIGIVAGYMTDEVRNLSPFTFIHQDDVRWVIVALRQMYDCNSSYGESTYRLITRNGNFIYLQTKGYLEIDKETNKVHSFVCVNTLLDEEDGKRRVQDMKTKFSVIINTKIPQSSIDAPASENPQQLEKAVLCLIQNLQKSSDADELHQARFKDQKALTGSRASLSSSARSTKTPPLDLVPPEPASVKTSISKSVNVVNVTAAKNLRDNQKVKSPHISGTDSTTAFNPDLGFLAACTCQVKSGSCKYCQHTIEQMIPSSSPNLKRSVNCSENEDIKRSKRRLKSTDIEQVLSTSLDQIGRTLDEQLNAAIELRNQGTKYEVPNSHQRINEIMEEHQKQSEIFVNIKTEYEVQIQNKSNDVSTTNANTFQLNNSSTRDVVGVDDDEEYSPT